jgi:hypothetical protein
VPGAVSPVPGTQNGSRTAVPCAGGHRVSADREFGNVAPDNLVSGAINMNDRNREETQEPPVEPVRGDGNRE